MADLSPVAIGSAFLIPTPPKGMHLFIAIIAISPTRYLYLSLTSKKPRTDTHCVIQPGEGVPDFVQRESYIDFRQTQEISMFALNHAIESGHVHKRDMFSTKITTHIQNCALTSKTIQLKYKKMIQEYLNQ